MAFEAKMEELTTEMETYTLALLRKRHYISSKELMKELFGEHAEHSADSITSNLLLRLETEGKILSFHVWNDSADYVAQTRANDVYVSLPQYARKLIYEIERKNIHKTGKVELRGVEVEV